MEARPSDVSGAWPGLPKPMEKEKPLAQAVETYFSEGSEAMDQPKIDFQPVRVLAKQAALKARSSLAREALISYVSPSHSMPNNEAASPR